MKEQIIEEQWMAFERAVLAPTAPEVQRTEMRKAFYAGAAVLFKVLMDLGEPEISEDVGEATLERIGNEIQAYAKSLDPNNDTETKFYWQ